MENHYVKGDRVQILHSPVLKKHLRNKKGTVLRWCNDNVYVVNVDNVGEAVLTGTELIDAQKTKFHAELSVDKKEVEVYVNGLFLTSCDIEDLSTEAKETLGL